MGVTSFKNVELPICIVLQFVGNNLNEYRHLCLVNILSWLQTNDEVSKYYSRHLQNIDTHVYINIISWVEFLK